ncbi:hypothetical protein [Thiopseudomonas alkaliphila]|uniref:hypothetical protein n=1 Tax=Thiopseudomonas alkaliphila TaxID=1697053 RepID=UPI00130D4DE0|nr:hypothetical protein [Thiopseudomonas alkaliphila]
MPTKLEFNVPLTPVLLASQQEIQRLQQSSDPQDREALQTLLEVISPLLKKTAPNK